MSFVQGAANVSFLKKRHAALTAHHLYRGMEFTEDKRTLAEWIPLVMEGRPAGEEMATRMITGADVELRGAHLQPVRSSRRKRRLCDPLSPPRDGPAS